MKYDGLLGYRRLWVLQGKHPERNANGQMPRNRETRREEEMKKDGIRLLSIFLRLPEAESILPLSVVDAYPREHTAAVLMWVI